MEEKYTAIIAEIANAKTKGQPVLVGTTSIEKSETLAEMLKKVRLPSGQSGRSATAFAPLYDADQASAEKIFRRAQCPLP